MPSSKEIERIQSDALRSLLEQANVALDEERNTDSVRLSADAYLMLLKDHPELVEAVRLIREHDSVKAGLDVSHSRHPPFMWPPLGSTLEFSDSGEPTIEFRRKHLSFTEAIEYFEFTVETALNIEAGRLGEIVAGQRWQWWTPH